jgi:hypothetical protein
MYVKIYICTNIFVYINKYANKFLTYIYTIQTYQYKQTFKVFILFRLILELLKTFIYLLVSLCLIFIF